MAKSTQLVEYLSARGTDRQAQTGRGGFLLSAGIAFILAGAVLLVARVQSPVVVASEAASASWPDFASTGPAQVVPRADPAERDQRALADFIGKRFRVARDAAGGFVAAAFRAGAEHRVDPLLVLAVVAVESRFNPVAESSQGAIGLMQVLPKYHQDKLLEHGGDAALLDPALNIAIGTRILRDYLRRAGETESGLQMYGGAFDEPSAQYAGKVLLERARLEQLLARARRTDA
jgi:soluble lytic murein transglycosylase-like protein